MWLTAQGDWRSCLMVIAVKCLLVGGGCMWLVFGCMWFGSWEWLAIMTGDYGWWHCEWVVVAYDYWLWGIGDCMWLITAREWWMQVSLVAGVRAESNRVTCWCDCRWPDVVYGSALWSVSASAKCCSGLNQFNLISKMKGFFCNLFILRTYWTYSYVR